MARELLQYKIPQNVGIEDKIVGPLSLRQLIILFAGGGISYTLFAITSRIYELNAIEYFVICIPTLIAMAAALIKIHNVSFTKYVLLALEFSINPKKRMWDHRGILNVVDPDLTEKSKASKANATSPLGTEVGRKNLNLSDLSATLDSGGFAHLPELNHKDIDAVADDDLITEAYFGNKRKQSSTQNMYWRTRGVQKVKLKILADMEAKKKDEPIEPQVAPLAEKKAKAIDSLNPSPLVKENEKQLGPTEMKATLYTTPLPTEKQVMKKDPSDSALKPEAIKKDIIPALSSEKTEVTPTLKPEFKDMILTKKEKGEIAVSEGNAGMVTTTDPLPPQVKNESNGLTTTFILTKKESSPALHTSTADIRKEETAVRPEVEKQTTSPIPKNENKILEKRASVDSSGPEINTEAEPRKSKRKRRRKKKRSDTPARPDTQIDNTIKNEPAKIIPKTQPSGHEDISLEDLQAGNEIEINLD